MNAREKLIEGNRRYCAAGNDPRREQTAKEGQHPYAIVICCSDSRVIPEKIFSADIGDLFVIRVAGNVLDRHALGSIEYAAEHLGCSLVLMLGHTGCGAVAAALSGHAAGFVSAITDAIKVGIYRPSVREMDTPNPRRGAINAIYSATMIPLGLSSALIDRKPSSMLFHTDCSSPVTRLRASTIFVLISKAT